ncbi:hypothetical protein RE428_04310 [Marinobacter nanhaiticus D15-8W]|uniref:SLC13 family permease n=1 Tax=Marinobacter nanhaiticus D15-8W TaxID=626887 RepID=N6WTP8_9GAMM|nr:hypothetical protein [Marinobacter nanhaiticus]ENO14891.1 hypothetical protein J057_06061 [Marinobacter nanhaiticus D15-8W]BES69413.1 hypothetical protein RE428_04310 [Marinobacter nanhaiticus D15-8W]
MTQYFLPAAVLCELIALLTGSHLLSLVAGSIFLVYFLPRLGRLEGYARYLMLVTVTMLTGFLLTDRLSGPQLAEAATAAAFYGAFLGSLGTMQCLVRRFEVLRRIHDVLLGGKPAWLYPKYVLTSCSVASVLNFGVMNLLCGALSETLSQRGITGTARLRWLRSVLSSTLRGFALVPLIAPTSVAVAIITREVPSLSWVQILPFSATAAVVFIGVGWLLEYRRFSQVSAERTLMRGWPAGTGRLVAVIAIVFALMALLVLTTPLNVSRAAMLSVPTVTFLYMWLTDRGLVAVAGEVADSVAGLHNEICIFAASAALGVALSAQVPPEVLSQLLDGRASLFILAACSMLILPLLATVGIAPITVLSFLAGLLSQFAASGLEPLLVAVALVIGFSLAMMLSPFGPSVMLLSRFGQLSRWVVAFGWNGVFALTSIPLMLLLLWVWLPWAA